MPRSILALAAALAIAAGCTLPRTVLSSGGPLVDTGSSMDAAVVAPQDTGVPDPQDAWRPTADDAVVVVPPDAGSDTGPICPMGACCPACGAGQTCAGGTCIACGAPSQPCCAGGMCMAPATCMSGTCSMPACGASGQPCCASDTCATTSLVCERPTFGAPRCTPCGGTNQTCCASDRCDVGEDTCLFGTCRVCGTPFTHCCSDNSCLYTSHCAGGNCVY